MDAAQALADLTEISSQIEAAVIVETGGAVAASTFADSERAKAFADAAAELLAAADGAGRAGLQQLEAVMPEGAVFVVRDGKRLIAAVTGPEPTVGLVFYDLKTTLRLAFEEAEPAAKGAREEAKGGEAEA
jgi:predicted regulator of Ras-like GTPase activity (Roadblock/LC7/MglB family)